jgi:hypothetical protein
MPAANVTSVAVTCTDQPFTLGGTITNSPGVTLANGSDVLSVPSSTGTVPFTMPQTVRAGSPYNVTVSNYPGGQICSVVNGTGVMGAANVTDVAVSCAASSYTVGGALHGLVSGDVLVIANNNGDRTTVDPTQPSYTMAEPVALGGSYSLTIVMQPVGKTCEIVHASGVDVTANITNADVTCAAISRTIGGTITGLIAANGLVLQDNGGDNTSINANATTFTMKTSLPEGGNYSITIATQPTPATVTHATSTISCAVSNGTGVVGDSDVTTVAIRCSNTLAFTAAGGPYGWTVPPGIDSINVIAIGGGGGAGGSGGTYYGAANGGPGGMVSATLAVAAGQSLALAVGGGGNGGSFTAMDFGGAGGGGGSSSVNAGGSSQIIAGGGGGGCSFSVTGIGGSGNGGAGGGSVAGQGGAGGMGGVGGADGGQGGYGGSGNGGPGSSGGTNPSNSVPGGAGGSGIGTGSGGVAGNMGGGGGGGYGGGGGGVSGGGGGGGSTGPAGSTIAIAQSPGPGSPGIAALDAAGSAGTDGAIVISY